MTDASRQPETKRGAIWQRLLIQELSHDWPPNPNDPPQARVTNVSVFLFDVLSFRCGAPSPPHRSYKHCVTAVLQETDRRCVHAPVGSCASCVISSENKKKKKNSLTCPRKQRAGSSTHPKQHVKHNSTSPVRAHLFCIDPERPHGGGCGEPSERVPRHPRCVVC
jgi:hypothetical protein